MRSETFFPSFSARSTFCKSKFRQDESTINGIPYNIRDKSILLNDENKEYEKQYYTTVNEN